MMRCVGKPFATRSRIAAPSGQPARVSVLLSSSFAMLAETAGERACAGVGCAFCFPLLCLLLAFFCLLGEVLTEGVVGSLGAAEPLAARRGCFLGVEGELAVRFIPGGRGRRQRKRKEGLRGGRRRRGRTERAVVCEAQF